MQEENAPERKYLLPSNLERYLDWYAHYVKGGATPARPAPPQKFC
jgi:hypothetical protein